MKLSIQQIAKGIRYLRHYGGKEFMIRLREKQEQEDISYPEWYEKHRATEAQLQRQRKLAATGKNLPCISIVVPVFHTPEQFLREMIESVQKQTYGSWQLCLADGSSDDSVEKIVAEYAADDRITYKHMDENLGIAGNTNAAIAMAKGEFLAFLDHDDLLAPDALFEAADMIRKGYDMIYTDEDKVDGKGQKHFEPHLKPDFNEDLLRSNNYITHFFLVKRELAEAVGEIRKEFEGAQDYDFILRCSEQASKIGHIPRILYHWRSHEESTAEDMTHKQYAIDAGARAIAAHIERMGESGTVTPHKEWMTSRGTAEATEFPGFYDVSYKLQKTPLVSIIIPNKDEVESLKKCLASIEKSSYQNYEVIIVENNSQPETFQYYEIIAPTHGISGTPSAETYEGILPGGQRICVAVWKEAFNYSKLNNFGTGFANGDYFVLLNNDIEIISTDWLEAMLSNCQRKNVGIVGAKLYYPDDTVQHAGIVVGIGGHVRGVAANMFAGLPRSRSGYFHKASLQMDYSAVTAACMMVPRNVYQQVKGFEEQLAVAFNDVDFCLKVRKAGYLVVYDPNVEAYHYESKSRGQEDSKEKVERFQSEIEFMRSRWVGILKDGDPYYNPNLSHIYTNYSLRQFGGKNL
jgi:GT2 family glycosyltransferase